LGSYRSPNSPTDSADEANFFIIARDSAQECVPILELARRRNLLSDDAHRTFREQIEVIAKMTSGLISGMDKRDP
jgi:four helix bundle protein